MSLYRPLLTAAWQTTVHARRLWGWSLLGSLVIGSGVGTALLQTLAASPDAALAMLFVPPHSARQLVVDLWTRAQGVGSTASVALIAFGVVLAVLLITLTWLTATSTNALILGAAARREHAALPPDLARQARARWWPTTAVHVLTKATAALLLTAWGSLLFSSATSATPSATATAMVGFILVAIVLSIIHILTPLAIAEITIDRLPTIPALREAFALLRTHWLVVTEASVLFSLAHVAALLLWAIGSTLLLLPFGFLAGIAVTQRSPDVLRAAIVAGLPVFAAFVAAVAVALTTFLATAWTHLYLRLTAPGDPPEPWLTRATSRRLPIERRSPHRS